MTELKASVVLELKDKFTRAAARVRGELGGIEDGSEKVREAARKLQNSRPETVYSRMSQQALKAGRASEVLSRKERAIYKINQQLISQDRRRLELVRQRAMAQERLNKAQAAMKSAAVKAGAVAGTGVASAYAGQRAARGVFNFGNALRPEEKARGELATMGIQDMQVIIQRARQMQSEVAGITSDVFLNASYDIKSGISTLTDEGVAAQTASAGYVSKATKANINQMTSLFATGYGIYKQQFATLSDSEFGERFGASLVGAVQTFKTDGAKMQQAIESAGSDATLLGQKMSETFTILGMLQQKMQAGEAGTALRAFSEKAGDAQAKFAELATKSKNPVVVRVLDENNMLRTMPDILTDLRARYGDTLDAMESREIASVFGSSEAVKVIKSLWMQESALKANTMQMEMLAAKGDSYSQAVAKIAGDNYDDKLIVQQQHLARMRMEIGEKLIPVMEQLLPYFTKGIDKIREFTAEHPNLVKWIGMTVMGLSALGIVGGGLLLTIAPMILSFYGWRLAMAAVGIKGGALKTVLGGLWSVLKRGGSIALFLGKKALPVVLTALRSVSVTLIANPIGLTIMAIAGGAYLIYKNWDKIHQWWTTTTWQQKAIDVSMMLNPLGLFWRTAKTTWQWWSQTTWGKKSIEIGTELLAKVGIDTKQVLNWWNNTTWQQKTLDIGNAPIKLVHSLAMDFVNWWNGISLKSLVPDIKMPDISGAWGKFKATIGIKGDAVDAPKYGGARATGGAVMPGSFYRVNELGPELLTMGGDTYLMAHQAGHVTPLISKTQSAANMPRFDSPNVVDFPHREPVDAPRIVQVKQAPVRGAGGSQQAHTVHNEAPITINITVNGGSDAASTGREVAKEVEKALRQMQRRGAVKGRSAMHDGRAA